MKFVKRVINLIAKYILPIFAVSLLLVAIPPFYVFPPIRNALLTTHSLARIIIFILFLVVVLKQVFEKKLLFGKKGKLLLTLFLIYFVFQSLSVFPATDIVSFFERYKDVLFPGLFLFVTLALPKSREKIILVLLISVVINFLYQMVMFWLPNLYQSVGSWLMYERYFELTMINIERARLFIGTYDEMVIPFLFVLAIKLKKPYQKILMLLLFLFAATPSLLSNFRSRILMLAFAFLASYIFLTSKKVLMKLNFIVTFVVIIYFTASLLNTIFGFSFVDRLTFQNEREDFATVEVRLKNLEKIAEVGLAYPVFGLGLGNPPKGRFRYVSIFAWVNREAEIASRYPHNIFAQILAETGIFSLLFYVGMLGYFVKTDIKAMLKSQKDIYKKAFIISFWTIFLYSLFNPTITLGYNTLFWILRAMI